MEFKSLKNIETSFRSIRLFTFACIGACALITIVSVAASFSFAERQRQKIYILDEGKSLMLALSQDMEQNRPVEARQHVKRFHELFFTLAPDKAAIEENVQRSLLLADRSAESYYRNLQEKGYYNRIIAGNISQTVSIDSMQCSFDGYPYTVNTFATQRIIRESTVTERSLISTCHLRNSLRSDNNPHGFLIENFTILENKDIRSYER